MEASVHDNLALVSWERYTRGAQFISHQQVTESVEHMAASLQIKTGAIRTQAVKTLSGGNQQKTVIGKWLLARPGVLIMDEPTRGIDVGAKYEIYSLMNDLAAQGTAILCISSELEELRGVCDRIGVMSHGELQAVFGRAQFDQKAILEAAFKGHTAHTYGPGEDSGL